MAHVKIIDPAGWNFGQPIATMVKVSSRGLIGNDRNDFIKTAGHAFLPLLDSIKVAKDEVPVHQLALGATEFYGKNRNGDGFSDATCRRHHQSFEKFARAYRDHKNTDPAKSYGYVKASVYNDIMHRVELLTMLNASKEAAERNGGLVADREIRALEKKGEYPISMACRVPYDVCDGCGNKARTRAEYCTEQTCKYGGCRDNITKVAEDGHVLGVDNPEPVWFDISDVYRGADRIAYGARADYLQKAASHQFLPGAVMAEMLGVTAPFEVCMAQQPTLGWGETSQGHYKLAMALAQQEKLTDSLSRETYRAFDPRLASVSDAQLAVLGTPGTEKAAAALMALAAHQIILPLAVFGRWRQKEAMVPTAAQLLPDVYRRLVESGSLEQMLLRNPYATTKTASLDARLLAVTLAPDYSLDVSAVRARAMRSAGRELELPNLKSGFDNQKQASDHPDAASLAEEYALYKLAALYRIAEIAGDFKLTASLAIGQNRVC